MLPPRPAQMLERHIHIEGPLASHRGGFCPLRSAAKSVPHALHPREAVLIRSGPFGAMEVNLLLTRCPRGGPNVRPAMQVQREFPSLF